MENWCNYKLQRRENKKLIQRNVNLNVEIIGKKKIQNSVTRIFCQFNDDSIPNSKEQMKMR